jgi:hypothetical protein
MFILEKYPTFGNNTLNHPATFLAWENTLLSPIVASANNHDL